MVKVPEDDTVTGIRDLTQSYMIGPISCSYFPKSSKLLLNTLGRQSQGLHLIYIMLKACRALLTPLKTWGAGVGQWVYKENTSIVLK